DQTREENGNTVERNGIVGGGRRRSSESDVVRGRWRSGEIGDRRTGGGGGRSGGGGCKRRSRKSESCRDRRAWSRWGRRG
ncbi:unnamed protein product, partial [Brassica rapa]